MNFDRRRIHWWLFFLAGLTPFLYLSGLVGSRSVGPDPGEFITRYTGEWSLVMLLVCLAVTPVNQLLKWRWVVKYRRMTGLYSWFYAVLHFFSAIFLVLDVRILDKELLSRPYVVVGFVAFLILNALAVTSPNAMVKKLGKNWKVLHRGIYVASMLVVIHFFWQIKADYAEPLLYAFLLGLLFVHRFYWAYGRNRLNQIPRHI
jgi:methionine sulfoxide reductase heme-binding subunit